MPKDDNAIQPFDEQGTAVATAEPAEFDHSKPPEGHRIRVDPDDLTQASGETDAAFAQRRHEYRTAPDPLQPDRS